MDIEQFLRDDGSLNLSKLTKSKEGKLFLIEAANKYGECKPAQLAYRVKNDILVLPDCKGCGKQLTEKNFIDFTKGYREYCCQSCSSRYGPAHEALLKTIRSEEFKTNRKKKIIERYGTSSMISINRDKATKTSIERYGVDNPLKSDYAKQRKVETIIERYGVDNVWKHPAIQQKIKETLQGRYGVDSPLKLVDWSKVQVTKGHQIIIDIIREIDQLTEIRVNDRKLIDPYELDVYLPEYNLAIEFNGLFWHSESAGKTSSYHLDKTKSVEDKGVQLIHVFEDEIRDKFSIVQSRIRNLMHKNKTIYARKCSISTIDSKTSDEFLEKCHIQGKARAKFRFGLFYESKLVALMTFGKPRFNSNYEWELIRYASELGINVVGGASKLLAAFRREHLGRIISYADRRWSQGGLYKKIGFIETGTTKPSYFYIDPKTSSRINRVSAQKHRLDQLLETFDPELSEAENMKRAGFERIFDCGNYVFEL